MRTLELSVSTIFVGMITNLQLHYLYRAIIRLVTP